MEKYKSSSVEREAKTTLKPRIFMMFVAESKYLVRGKAEHLRIIVEKYYDSLNASHQRQLLDIYEKFEKENKPKK